MNVLEGIYMLYILTCRSFRKINIQVLITKTCHNALDKYELEFQISKFIKHHSHHSIVQIVHVKVFSSHHYEQQKLKEKVMIQSC